MTLPLAAPASTTTAAPSTLPRLAAACGAGFLWGTGSLVVNLLVHRHGYQPQSISFWRFVVGSVALLAVFGRRLPWARLLREGAPLLAAGSVMAGYVLAWFQGIALIGAAIPTLIALCLPPVFVTLWTLLRRRAPPDAELLGLLALALIGTLALVAGHRPPASAIAGRPPLATWLAGIGASLASALLYAGFTLSSPGLSQRWGASASTTALTIVATAMMALSALWSPLQWPHDATPEAGLLYLGLVTAALALFAFNWGAARLTPTALTLATLVEPLTAVLLAALVLGERLTPLQWTGAALLLAGLYGWGRREARSARPPHG